jgi:uncharacterized repeat protein (TIGR02543 family)
MNKSKKFATLCFLVPMCILLAFTGFSIFNSKIQITFNVNPDGDAIYGGEAVAPIVAAPTAKITLPSPIRTGYRFEGWTTDPDKRVPIEKVNKKKTELFAIWSKFEPAASLYVDGNFIKTAAIPAASLQAGNGLGDDFIPKFNANWRINSNILGVYQTKMDTFFGWYYYDETGRRRELRYFAGENVKNRWQYYDQAAGGSTVAARAGTLKFLSTAAFYPAHDIALNAMFNNTPHTTTTTAKNAPDNVTVRYLNLDGTPIAAHEQTAAFGSKIAVRSGQYVSVANANYFVGWYLENQSDIYQYSNEFYLDPALYLSYANVINFRPVVTTSDKYTAALGVYKKYIQNGVVAIKKEVGGSTIRIDALDPVTVTAAFDFNGEVADRLRWTNLTAEEFASNGEKYHAPDDEDTHKTAPARNGVIDLPLPTNFAVGGRVFGGWEFNGRVYPAGLAFNVPFGAAGEIKFTAVWYNARTGAASIDQNRYGYDFNGYKNTATGEILPQLDDKYYPLMVYAAAWTPKDVKVNFDEIKFGSYYTQTRYQTETGFVHEKSGTEYLYGASFITKIQVLIDDKFVLNDVNILAPL